MWNCRFRCALLCCFRLAGFALSLIVTSVLRGVGFSVCALISCFLLGVCLVIEFSLLWVLRCSWFGDVWFGGLTNFVCGCIVGYEWQFIYWWVFGLLFTCDWFAVFNGYDSGIGALLFCILVNGLDGYWCCLFCLFCCLLWLYWFDFLLMMLEFEWCIFIVCGVIVMFITRYYICLFYYYIPGFWWFGCLIVKFGFVELLLIDNVVSCWVWLWWVCEFLMILNLKGWSAFLCVFAKRLLSLLLFYMVFCCELCF